MQYDANILHCTRQLHYSVHNENSIDIVLFANGIPVVSMELKCQFTGQDTTNAINQYKFDRAGKDAIFAFKERVLVHFAVDLTNVYMTTRLEGAHTYFLPFNQGSNGAGKVGGKGNPVNPNGYDTAYLWERVLCKDSLMEILQKYMHLQQEYDKNGNLVKETMIFPRYHQLDVVTKLLEDVKKNGSGKSYLIQHSAGSGKSNSIAWLAHRLTGLHDYEDNKIFQSVIIVTDRRVLDSQLQSTVYQFDHVEGVVKKVDKNSGQLRDAINDGVGIIITTLQKFPVIYKEVDSAKKRFAIIIDEAHSSQTGDAAKKLKRALADTEEILKEYAEMEDEDERNRKDDEDKLLDELAAQGMHKNLSFFAFTATPKGKTLQLFGQKDAEGIYRPFHIYSMRQAIEEHFILDVLQNYMTYKMYYKIAKIIEDNPEFDTTAGSKAIINYETLHPHNISQKTAIMLEHFMNVTRHKIGGRAKAMVVTPSRLHAVRYVQEFKRQIKEKGLNDLEVLVAFSGEVKDNDDVFTEEGMNKDKEGKGFIAHIDKLRSYLDAPEEIHLGRKPEDLLETLVNMVLGSPAICIYRSNGRSTARATSLAKVFVNNFNLPESTAIIDLAYGRCRDDNSHWQNVLKYCKDGCFQAMIDEYIHMLKETAGFQSDGNQYQIVHDMMMDSLKIHTATYIADTYPDFKKRINGADRKSDGCRIRSSYAVGFTKDAGDNSKVVMRKENIRNAFNSPMRPFVLATTSIGQEGLDFHNYCRVIMHWNLPSNPIDVGRILRTFKIKKNVEVTDNGKIII